MNREDLIIEKVGDPVFDLDKLAEDMGLERQEYRMGNIYAEKGAVVIAEGEEIPTTFYNITTNSDGTILLLRNNVFGNPPTDPFRFDIDVSDDEDAEEVEKEIASKITIVRTELGVDVENADKVLIRYDGRIFNLNDYISKSKEHEFDVLKLHEGELVKITIIYNPNRKGRKYAHDIIDAIGLVTDIGSYRMRLTIRCNPNEKKDTVHTEEVYLCPDELVNGRIKEFSIEKIEV